MRKIFRRLRRFIKALFGIDGKVTALYRKLQRHTETFTDKLDALLASTRLVLDVAEGKLVDLEDLGFVVPPKIAEALKRAALEVGYYDDNVSSEDGFKSVIVAIAAKMKGSEAHNQGVVFNIAKLALVRLFPELRKHEAELIISAALSLKK